MSDRGQAAWARCEMAIWAMIAPKAEALDVISSLEDRLRDMANRMSIWQLERLAEQWEAMVAKRKAHS